MPGKNSPGKKPEKGCHSYGKGLVMNRVMSRVQGVLLGGFVPRTIEIKNYSIENKKLNLSNICMLS